jgi:cell division protein FtsQ
MAEPARRAVPRRWALAAIGAVVLSGAVVAVTYTPLFAANDLAVRGAGWLSSSAVLSIAGLDARTNVFHLDTVAAERRLERDPRILRAEVTTALPDRVVVDVVLRTPVAVLGSPGELIGADGVVIGPVDGPVDLPALITGAGRPATETALASGAATAGALGPSLRPLVDAIVVGADGHLTVRLQGFSASLGEATELEAKSASLAALIAWIREEGVDVVSADLTVPGSPTAQLRRGTDRVPVP